MGDDGWGMLGWRVVGAAARMAGREALPRSSEGGCGIGDGMTDGDDRVMRGRLV